MPRIGQRVAAGVEVVRQVSPRDPPRLIARPFIAGTIIKFIGAGYLLGRTQEASNNSACHRIFFRARNDASKRTGRNGTVIDNR